MITNDMHDEAKPQATERANLLTNAVIDGANLIMPTRQIGEV
jgi:hypothetical protein